VPALLLGLLTSSGVVTVWHVALLAALLGTINALDIPVRQSFLAEMVGKGHIVNAIALNSAAFNGARIIGPVIAGLAIAYLGIPACFYLNALSFVAVIIALFRIQARGEARARPEGMLKDSMSGIRFVARSREIRNVFFLIAVFSIIGLPYISLLPIFAGEVFHKGAQGLGFLVGASGIGALTAALGIAALGDIRDKTRFMATTGLCFSLALLAFSLSGIFWLSLLVIMAAGWGMVSYLAAANSFIQVTVPDELRGRVMSVYSLVFLGTVPIGNAVMCFVADMVGTPRAVTASGVICLLAAGVFARRYLAKQDGV
jgi:MFS family permease